MIYLEHEFYSNFTNSLKYGETDGAIDMLQSEISDLITYYPQKLIDLFNKVDLQTKDGLSDEQLLDKLLDNFSTNVKLQKGITFILAEGNDVITSKMGATEAKAKIDNLSKGITPILKIVIANPDKRRNFKEAVITGIKVRASKLDNRKRVITTPKKSYKKLIITLVVLGVAGYFIYRYRKTLFPTWCGGVVAEQGAVVEGVAGAVPAEPIPTGAMSDIPASTPSIESEFDNYTADVTSIKRPPQPTQPIQPVQ